VFAKLREAALSFVMPVRPSVRPSVLMEQLDSHWTDSHEIWCWSIFRKSVQKVRASLKSDENNEYFAWRPIYIFYHISLDSSST